MPLFRRGAYRIQSAKPIEPLSIRGEEAFFIGLLQGDAPIPGQQPLDCKLSEQIPIYQPFGRNYQSRPPAKSLSHSAAGTFSGRVRGSAPNHLQQHGSFHRLRPCHRGGSAHHDRRFGRVVPLKPITELTEVSTQPPPMNEKQAIVLVVVLSVGLWALIWGLVIGLQALVTLLF
jgi:hypothetical protein